MLANIIDRNLDSRSTQLQIIDKNLRGLRDVLSNPSLFYQSDTVGENVDSLVNAFTILLQPKCLKSQIDTCIQIPSLEDGNLVSSSTLSSLAMTENMEMPECIVNSEIKNINYHEVPLPSSLLAKTSPLAKLGIILLNLNLALSAQDGIGMKFDVPEISQLDPELLESLTVAYNTFQENPMNVVIGSNKETIKFDFQKPYVTKVIVEEPSTAFNTIPITTATTIPTTTTITTTSADLPPPTTYCSKYNIPVISGPPIPYQPSTATTKKSDLQNACNAVNKKSSSNNNYPLPIKGPKVTQLPTTYTNTEPTTHEVMFAGGMPKLTTPTARAKKSMEEEHLLDMGRLQLNQSNHNKTVREIVSADPFQTNYSLEDVFQSLARENEVELQSFILRRNLGGQSHMTGGRGAGLESRVRRELKMERRSSHEFKIPMWS